MLFTHLKQKEEKYSILELLSNKFLKNHVINFNFRNYNILVDEKSLFFKLTFTRYFRRTFLYQN